MILGGTLAALMIRAGGHALEVELLFFGGWLLATAVHELGHAIAAYARGFRVISIVVGPIVVKRSPRTGFKLSVRRTLLGGRVMAVPLRWGAALSSGLRLVRRRRPRGQSDRRGLGSGTRAPWTPWLWGGRGGPGERALGAVRAGCVGGVGEGDRRSSMWRAESESPGERRHRRDVPRAIASSTPADIAGAGAILQRLIEYTCGTVRWPRTTISGEVAFEACVFEAAWRGDYTAASKQLTRAQARRSAGQPQRPEGARQAPTRWLGQPQRDP